MLSLGLSIGFSGGPAPAAIGVAGLGILPSLAASQGTGSVLGRITAEGGGTILQNARVSVTGTGIGVFSGEAGWYLLVGVPTGRHEMTVELPGFARATDTIDLGPEEALVVDFELLPDPVPVEGLVVSGEVQPQPMMLQGRIIEEEEIARRQAGTVTQLLQGLVPGLTLTVTSGDVGAAAQVRIRGIRSLEATPPLFVVDGVRVGSAQFGGPVGTGRVLAFLDNINPRDIQRIQILNAAEATTLFGTDAVGGAILIFTKR